VRIGIGVIPFLIELLGVFHLRAIFFTTSKFNRGERLFYPRVPSDMIEVRVGKDDEIQSMIVVVMDLMKRRKKDLFYVP